MLHPFTLHSSRKKLCMKAKIVFIVFQLIYKITVSSSICTRNNSHSLTKHWKLKFFLKFEDTFLFQQTNNLLTLSGHVTHRVSGVDISDYPRKAIAFMKLCKNFQHDLHACMNLLPCNAHKMRLYQLPSIGPTLS